MAEEEEEIQQLTQEAEREQRQQYMQKVRDAIREQRQNERGVRSVAGAAIAVAVAVSAAAAAAAAAAVAVAAAAAAADAMWILIHCCIHNCSFCVYGPFLCTGPFWSLSLCTTKPMYLEFVYMFHRFVYKKANFV